jgi:hypothetical protein
MRLLSDNKLLLFLYHYLAYKVNDYLDFLDKVANFRYTGDISEERTWHA